MKSIFTFGFLIGVVLVMAYLILPKNNLGANKSNETHVSNKTNRQVSLQEFSIDTPPRDTLNGKMIELTGDVSFESRAATAPAMIKDPVDVHQGEQIKIGEKGSATIIFENNLNLKLIDLADLSFPQTLPTNIVLNQKDGQVSYEKIGESPVAIRILHALLNIEKGLVIIGIDTDTNQVVINIKSGGATIGFNDIDNISTVVPLHEGKKYLFNSDLRTITLYNP